MNWRLLLSVSVVVIALGLFTLDFFFRRSYHKNAVVTNSTILKAVLVDWLSEGRPSGQQLSNILDGHGTFKPFVATNEIVFRSTNYTGAFGIKAHNFAPDESLIVTTNGFVFLVSDAGHRFIKNVLLP